MKITITFNPKTGITTGEYDNTYAPFQIIGLLEAYVRNVKIKEEENTRKWLETQKGQR